LHRPPVRYNRHGRVQTPFISDSWKTEWVDPRQRPTFTLKQVKSSFPLRSRVLFPDSSCNEEMLNPSLSFQLVSPKFFFFLFSLPYRDPPTHQRLQWMVRCFFTVWSHQVSPRLCRRNFLTCPPSRDKRHYCQFLRSSSLFLLGLSPVWSEPSFFRPPVLRPSFKGASLCSLAGLFLRLQRIFLPIFLRPSH